LERFNASASVPEQIAVIKEADRTHNESPVSPTGD
jgi:hypothetical protein|tara:strand:+ start:1502 stop:1606 length:105 start_codon:yes stop_codon:yes gene_type:complete